MAALADDLGELGQPVAAGFSTHPHWDHLLWHDRLGAAPRYGTARCAATAGVLLSERGWKARLAQWIPPDIAGQVPLDLLGRLAGLPAEIARIPRDGPHVRIIEHQAHAPGHTALLIEERGVLVAGDMLSDVLIPMLDLTGTADPIQDYLAALRLLEAVAGDVDALIPGHGSIGGADQVRARIDQDRAYLHVLRDAGVPGDPRVGPSATYGKDWLPGVHARHYSTSPEETSATRGPDRDPLAATGGCRSVEAGRRLRGGLRFPGALAPDARAQQSNTDQQMPFRNRWSSSTSSQIVPGIWSRCHRHSSRPAASASACGAAARAALIA
jgi:glyoxylase-like metal-dependent hydrolase (beta-lactamase superfamily II)